MTITALQKKARKGTLEVEDILKAATRQAPELPEVLSELAEELGWNEEGARPDGSIEIPFAKWASVAAAYSREGFAGLRKLAGNRADWPFLLGLVDEIKTSDAVEFVLGLSQQLHPLSGETAHDAAQLASSFNALLSFKSATPISRLQAKQVQGFLLNAYPFARSESERAVIILALRGVGDESALAFVSSCADFPAPWEQTKTTTLRAIRKHLQLRQKTHQ